MNLADTTLIILAAGKSSRMGSPKGLLLYEGKTLLDHHRDSFLKTGGEKIVVVLGSFVEEYTKACPWLKESFVLNEFVEKGPFFSLQLGLLKAINHSKAYFILPVDVPTSPSIWKLCENFNDEVLIPTFNEKGGHPVLISKQFGNQLLNVSIDSEDARLDHQIKKVKSIRLEINDPLIIKNFNSKNDL